MIFFGGRGDKDLYIPKSISMIKSPNSIFVGQTLPSTFPCVETWLAASDAREGGVTPRDGRGPGMEGRARERRRVGALLNAPGNLKGWDVGEVNQKCHGNGTRCTKNEHQK